MARQRRGGFRPPELRGTLGTLLRTTLEQAGMVRDAIGRSAREGRSRLDEALAHRRRKDALAELGELVLDLIRRGEIDLDELPEAQDLVRLLDELDADEPHEPDDRIAQSPTRGRFDARSRDRTREHDRDRDRAHDRTRDDDDGTVSAIRGRGPASGSVSGAASGPASGGRARSGPDASSASGSAASSAGSASGASSAGSASGASSASGRQSPPKPSAPPRVWRPTLVDDEPPPEPREALPARSLPRDPHRKGGIQFEEDDDLAEYMHPDDVPPKPPTDADD